MATAVALAGWLADWLTGLYVQTKQVSKEEEEEEEEEEKDSRRK